MDNRELKLTDFLSVAAKRIWILIAAAIIGIAVAVYYTNYMVTPIYKTESTFYIDLGTLSADDSGEPEQIDQLEAQRQVVGARYQIESYVAILDTRNFSEAIAEKLEDSEKYPLSRPYTAGAVNGAISFDYEFESEIFTVTVIAATPYDALSIARCVEDNAEDYMVPIKPIAVDTLRVIDNARASTVPTNINLMLNVIIGALFCVAVAYVICFLVEMNDVRIKSERGITEILGIPVIGAIPEYSHGVHKKNTRSGNDNEN